MVVKGASLANWLLLFGRSPNDSPVSEKYLSGNLPSFSQVIVAGDQKEPLLITVHAIFP